MGKESIWIWDYRVEWDNCLVNKAEVLDQLVGSGGLMGR